MRLALAGTGVNLPSFFGGDFKQHLLVHAAPTQGGFMLHAAPQAEPGGNALAVRYMKYPLQQTKEAVEAGLQGIVQSGAHMHRQCSVECRDIEVSLSISLPPPRPSLSRLWWACCSACLLCCLSFVTPVWSAA